MRRRRRRWRWRLQRTLGATSGAGGGVICINLNRRLGRTSSGAGHTRQGEEDAQLEFLLSEVIDRAVVISQAESTKREASAFIETVGVYLCDQLVYGMVAWVDRNVPDSDGYWAAQRIDVCWISVEQNSFHRSWRCAGGVHHNNNVF